MKLQPAGHHTSMVKFLPSLWFYDSNWNLLNLLLREEKKSSPKQHNNTVL